MADLQFFLFGRFEACCGGQKLTTFEARKAQELLCYLLLHSDHPHLREGLANLLWADALKSQPKTYLRKAIWQLQSALEELVEATRVPLIIVTPDWLQLDPMSRYWLDIRVFNKAFNLVKNIPGEALNQDQVQKLERATQLYTGDFLEGCYADWCLIEREHFKHMYLAMQDKLMRYHEVHQNYEQGIACGIKVLRHDPTQERTHQNLMRLYCLAGNRIEALRQFECCEIILEKELQVKPAKQTQLLYQQIRNDQITVSTTTIPPFVERPSSSHLSNVLDTLQEYGNMLTHLNDQIQQEIQTVKQIIDNKHYVD